MLLGVCPSRGDCGYCCDWDWKVSAEDGRECSIVIVLEDCMGGGRTSAIGSGVVRGGVRGVMLAIDGC